MFENENVGLIGAKEKKEKKKIIKMKDVFEVPSGKAKLYEKKEKIINDKIEAKKEAKHKTKILH